MLHFYPFGRLVKQFFLLIFLLIPYTSLFAQSTPIPRLYDFQTYTEGDVKAADTNQATWVNPEYGLTFISNGLEGTSLQLVTASSLNPLMLNFERVGDTGEVQEVIIKSTGIDAASAGGEFKLNALKFALFTASKGDILFKTYRDGILIGSVAAASSSPTALNNIEVQLNPAFYNIDEIRISGFPDTGIKIDNIDLTGKITNTAPFITSDGAGPAANINNIFFENTTFVTDVNATDSQNDTLVYSLAGGADSSEFQIDPVTGILSFKVAPNYENPTDADSNNTYIVIVKAAERDTPDKLFDTQTLTVTVNDVTQGVQSITRLSENPTMQDTVRYLVTFEGSNVSGVTAANFGFTTTDSLEDVSIESITGSGLTRTVLVNTGTGHGTFRLDLINSTGISPGASNVPYTSGEVYTKIVEPLPVELIAFKATNQDARVVLQWATASEQQNKGFEIQRSANGKSFTSIDFVAGAGTTSQLTNYTTTDRSPLTGTSYYRLKQIDFSGKMVYSRIVAVTRSQVPVVVQVAPNPVIDVTTISVQLPAAQICQVRLIDMSGRILYSRQVSLMATDALPLDMTNYPAGIYVLTIQGANQVIYQGKLLKK